MVRKGGNGDSVIFFFNFSLIILNGPWIVVWICCVFPGWCMYELSLSEHCGGWWCSRERAQRRQRRPWSPRRRKTWQKCEETVCLFFYLFTSLYCENYWWSSCMFSFQGKPGLPGVQGPVGPKGSQVGMFIYFIYFRVYKYMQRIVSTHVSMTDCHLCCTVPPVGRSWSCRSWPSRTTSKADVSLTKDIWINKEVLCPHLMQLSHTYTQLVGCGPAVISVMHTMSSHDIRVSLPLRSDNEVVNNHLKIYPGPFSYPLWNLHCFVDTGKWVSPHHSTVKHLL